MGFVLVVEDEPINATLVLAVLSRDGHRLLMAGDGTTALDLAHREVPDLSLLAVALAGKLPGLDVCRALRADPATAGVAILMLSGRAFDSDVVAGYRAGADGYLPQPFDNVELRNRVRHLIDHPPTCPNA